MVQKYTLILVIFHFLLVGFTAHASPDGDLDVFITHSHVGGDSPHHHQPISNHDTGDHSSGPMPHTHAVCLGSGFIFHINQPHIIYISTFENAAFPDSSQELPPHDPHLDSIFRPPIFLT